MGVIVFARGIEIETGVIFEWLRGTFELLISYSARLTTYLAIQMQQ